VITLSPHEKSAELGGKPVYRYKPSRLTNAARIGRRLPAMNTTRKQFP
jgi:hypothetical protein